MENILIKDLPIRVTADLSKLNESDFNNRNHNFLKKISNSNNNRYIESKRALINMLSQTPTLIDFFNKTENLGKKFEVVFPKEALKKIENGEWALNKSNEGIDLFTTSIRDLDSGKIVKNVKLHEITNLQQIDTLLPTLQNMAIQQALSQISNKLESIEKKIDQILSELHNDRVGKLQAGYALYLDSLHITDKSLKDQSLLLAVSHLAEGRSQLIETGKQKFVEFYKNEGFWTSLLKELTSKSHKGNQKKLIIDFAQSLFYIQRSTQIIAEIYYELGQNKTLLQSLSPYRDFMNEVCTPKGLNALDDWNIKAGWREEIRGIRRALKAIPLHPEISELDYHIEINNEQIKID